MRKVSFDLPASLIQQVQTVIHDLHLPSTSSFLRLAVERYLDEYRKAKLERELESGYLANEELSARVHSEFMFVDAEQP